MTWSGGGTWPPGHACLGPMLRLIDHHSCPSPALSFLPYQNPPLLFMHLPKSVGPPQPGSGISQITPGARQFPGAGRRPQSLGGWVLTRLPTGATTTPACTCSLAPMLPGTGQRRRAPGPHSPASDRGEGQHSHNKLWNCTTGPCEGRLKECQTTFTWAQRGIWN